MKHPMPHMATIESVPVGIRDGEGDARSRIKPAKIASCSPAFIGVSESLLDLFGVGEKRRHRLTDRIEMILCRGTMDFQPNPVVNWTGWSAPTRRMVLR
jgi:hypothetical protein